MALIKTDYRQAQVDLPTMKMLEFVEVMTLKPISIQKNHVAELKEAGFSDTDILDIVHIAGFFNHINRVADALGVDLENFMVQGK